MENDAALPTASFLGGAAGGAVTSCDGVIKGEGGGVEIASGAEWHRDEHARFMQALETFGGEKTGDEWKKIAAFVQTRSTEDVRLHGRQYLQHLMQLQVMQQHNQQHLNHQRLLQLSRMSHALAAQAVDPMQYPLSASRELQGNTSNNQNDPNGQNHVAAHEAEVYGSKKAKVLPTGRGKGTAHHSPLSAAAMCVANATNTQTQMGRARQGESTMSKRPGGAAAARKQKLWSFQEDKVLETSLAAWQRGKPYSWARIAANLPGKTAKDVRVRYEQLVEDIAKIDAGGDNCGLACKKGPVESPSYQDASSTPTSKSPSSKPPQHSGRLSSRISPPPPIQVPPPLSAKSKGSSGKASLESTADVPGSARSRSALTPSFGGASGMLSPTFLEFLANEDKQPLAFAGMTDLPSPVLPSPSPSSSARTSTMSSMDASGYLGPLPSPLGIDLTTPRTSRRRQLATPKGVGTPRIWQEFLSDDFKFDSSRIASPARLSTTADGTSSGVCRSPVNEAKSGEPEDRRTSDVEMES